MPLRVCTIRLRSNCVAKRDECRSLRPLARSGQCVDGRRRHCRLGFKVSLPILASRHGYPRSRPRYRTDRSRRCQSRHQGRPDVHPLGFACQQHPWAEFHSPLPRISLGTRRDRWLTLPDLCNVYQTDEVPFTFVSDEFNGVTKNNDGITRPLIPRSFKTLSQAEEENGQSRIYLESIGSSTRPTGSGWKLRRRLRLSSRLPTAARVTNSSPISRRDRLVPQVHVP